MLYCNTDNVWLQNHCKSNAAVWVFSTVYLVVDEDPVRVFAGTELQTVVHGNRVVRLLFSVNLISYRRKKESEREVDMTGKSQ